MNPDIIELKKRLDTLEAAFYLNNFTASQDFSKYSRFNTRMRIPIFASAPSVCEIGEVYANSGTGKAYICTSANTWTLIGSQT